MQNNGLFHVLSGRRQRFFSCFVKTVDGVLAQQCSFQNAAPFFVLLQLTVQFTVSSVQTFGVLYQFSQLTMQLIHLGGSVSIFFFLFGGGLLQFSAQVQCS
jgi:hypothetical protein